MGVKVAKFGGSSVADGIQLTKIKDIIFADPDRKYIVVSAPGKRFDGDSKITDLLYLCKTHMEHNLPYEQIFQVIEDRYVAVALNLGVETDLQEYFDRMHDTQPNAVFNTHKIISFRSHENIPEFNMQRETRLKRMSGGSMLY